jgi:hypothetical protein
VRHCDRWLAEAISHGEPVQKSPRRSVRGTGQKESSPARADGDRTAGRALCRWKELPGLGSGSKTTLNITK